MPLTISSSFSSLTAALPAPRAFVVARIASTDSTSPRTVSYPLTSFSISTSRRTRSMTFGARNFSSALISSSPLRLRRVTTRGCAAPVATR